MAKKVKGYLRLGWVDDGCKTTTSTHGRCAAISPDRIFAAGHPDRAHARLLSAAALSLVNRSCRASLMDSIALIINYLGVPLGMAFIG